MNNANVIPGQEVRTKTTRVEEAATAEPLQAASSPQKVEEAGIDVDAEIRRILQPLTEEELKSLEESIAAHGVLNPIVTWHGIVLDGRNRLAIGGKLNIEVPRKEIELAGPEDAVLWAINHQLGRRNLTDSQRAALAAMKLEKLAAASRHDRAVKGAQARHGSGCSEVESASEQKPSVRLREQVAKEAGVPESAVRTVAAVAKKDPSLVQDIVAGKKTIRQANKEVRAKAEGKQPSSQTAKPLKAASSQPQACPVVSGLDAVLGDMMILRNHIEAVCVTNVADKERAKAIAAELRQSAGQLEVKAKEVQEAAVA